MAKGLKLPVGVNSKGGAALVEGDEHADKIITIGLGGGESDNAFQQGINLGERHVFDPADPGARASILQRLFRLFSEWEALELYRLLPGTITWEEDSANQDLILGFRYRNLESDEEVPFRRRFTGGSA